jgi:site-specific DNA-methyltransferase (adenine-specific)
MSGKYIGEGASALELNRIYQRDCIEGMRLIPDKSVDMILCDLPYGTTACKWDTIIPFEPLWEQYKRVIKDSGVIVLFADEPFTSSLIMSNTSLFRYRITWDKDIGGGYLNAKKMPLKQTEDICVFSPSKLGNHTYNPIMRNKEDNRIRPTGNRKPVKPSTYGHSNGQLSKDYNNKKSHPTNLIKLSSRSAECNTRNRVHPTQKPVVLFEYLIRTYTNENETVLDNCIGSGTTAVAALRNNRNFIGFETEPEYVRIANQRLESLTDAEAERKLTEGGDSE